LKFVVECKASRKRTKAFFALSPQINKTTNTYRAGLLKNIEVVGAIAGAASSSLLPLEKFWTLFSCSFLGFIGAANSSLLPLEKFWILVSCSFLGFISAGRPWLLLCRLSPSSPLAIPYTPEGNHVDSNREVADGCESSPQV